VVRALAWIKGELERNPGRVMTNAEIAEAAGCSVPWLQHLFKRHLGLYPVQAARQARVDRAIELLAETEEPVAVVAAMCGFVSPSHLSRVLQQRVGTHASGLRKAMREGVAKPVRRGAVWTGALLE
jgi:transcriptional regulator GlxA family with amidase domain